MDAIDTTYLSKTHKMVYTGHRHFLPHKHPFRKIKSQFDGKIDNRDPPKQKLGKDVYDLIKAVNVVLGKRNRSSKVQKEVL